MNSTKTEFICPECGSDQADIAMCIDPFPDDTSIWGSVMEIIGCAACEYQIPAHLGERWDGLSVDEAKAEWRALYRETAPKS